MAPTPISICLGYPGLGSEGPLPESPSSHSCQMGPCLLPGHARSLMGCAGEASGEKPASEQDAHVCPGTVWCVGTTGSSPGRSEQMCEARMWESGGDTPDSLRKSGSSGPWPGWGFHRCWGAGGWPPWDLWAPSIPWTSGVLQGFLAGLALFSRAAGPSTLCSMAFPPPLNLTSDNLTPSSQCS